MAKHVAKMVGARISAASFMPVKGIVSDAAQLQAV